MIEIDLDEVDVRAINDRLHKLPPDTNERLWRIVNPKGAHALAVGLDRPIEIEIAGHVGYYCAGMNKAATITIKGHAGPGLAENIVSGTVRVSGNASQSAAASGRGGLVVIQGDASSRCGISMKGVDIVVGGSVGHKGFCLAFMADVFGGILSSNGFPGAPHSEVASNGTLIVVINVQWFASLATLRSDVSKLVDYVKDTPLAKGSEGILYPGEKEVKTRKERSKKGIEIEDDTWNQVMALVKEYGVAGKLGKLP